jgi:hypothetical protein
MRRYLTENPLEFTRKPSVILDYQCHLEIFINVLEKYKTENLMILVLSVSDWSFDVWLPSMRLNLLMLKVFLYGLRSTDCYKFRRTFSTRRKAHSHKPKSYNLLIITIYFFAKLRSTECDCIRFCVRKMKVKSAGLIPALSTRQRTEDLEPHVTDDGLWFH